MVKLVVVRAAGGKPVKLAVVDVGERLVYVANPDSLLRVNGGLSEPVGVPKEDVFKYDESAYRELCREWNEMGIASWEQVTPHA